MKKLLSLLLAVCMLMTGTAALAESAPDPATQITGSIHFNRDAFFSFFPFEEDSEEAHVIAPMLDLMDCASFSMTSSEHIVSYQLFMNDLPVADMTLLLDENQDFLVSSMFPHFGVCGDLGPRYMLGSTELTEADMQVLLNALLGYILDLSVYGAQIYTSFAGQDSFTLTSRHLTEALEMLYARLTADEVQAILQSLWSQPPNAMRDTEASEAPNPLAQFRAWLDEQKAAEETDIANVSLRLEADRIHLQADVSSHMLLTCDVFPEDNAQIVEISTLVSAENPVSDWDALRSSILNGSCGEDAGLATLSLSLTDTGDQLVLSLRDTDVDVSCRCSATMDTGEDEQQRFLYRLDVASAGTPLYSLQFAAEQAELPAPPSLEGLTLIDSMTMTDEEQQALTADVVGYGLPALMARMQQAAPDQVAKLLQMIMMLQMGQLPDVILSPLPDNAPAM